MNERLKYLEASLKAIIMLGIVTAACVDGDVQKAPQQSFSDALKSA